MKYAVVYRRRGKLIVGAQGRTHAGVLIGIGAVVVIDTFEPDKIGSTLREVLKQSESPLRHPQPSEWTAITNRFLSGSGVKTWGSFMRGARLLTVMSNGESIQFQPHENRGARDAFQPMGLPPLTIAAAESDEALGEAVLKALDIAASREVHKPA
jgi:hypothetical protein